MKNANVRVVVALVLLIAAIAVATSLNVSATTASGVWFQVIAKKIVYAQPIGSSGFDPNDVRFDVWTAVDRNRAQQYIDENLPAGTVLKSVEPFDRTSDGLVLTVLVHTDEPPEDWNVIQ